MENKFTSLVDAHQYLLNNGFEKNFKIVNNQTMIDDNGHSYKPSQVTVMSFHRFEGETDPGDNSIIYAVQTKDGKKGTIVSSYGSGGSRKFSEFIMNVKDKKDHTMLKRLIASKDEMVYSIKLHDKLIIGIAAGIAVGVIAGLLLAPKKKSLADKVACKINELKKISRNYRSKMEV